MKNTMTIRTLAVMAAVLVLLYIAPLIVIARVTEVPVNWFYLVSAAALSLTLAFFLIWRVYALQQQKSRLRDRINHFVHELKSPLTAVTIGLEGLRDDTTRRDPLLANEYLNISQLELERLTRMVENTLRLFNYDEPGAAIQIQPLNLEKVVQQALKSVQLQAQQRNAEILVEIQARELRMHGDRMHLNNVVVNLLENALKYTLATPRIVVTVQKDGDHALLTVRDNGMGIAPEQQPYVFDKHFRGGHHAGIKGHGLGLHYVAWVVRKHNGEIGLESAEGKGSNFWVRLPLAGG
ncbi:MAG: HAMP domain-containing sensor histidine kinase [Saprospiraceae bacterium]|nr:HAMP domain-containing sensor histidine kinase [Saprospiraceae bacterium]